MTLCTTWACTCTQKIPRFFQGVSKFLCIQIQYPSWKYDFGCNLHSLHVGWRNFFPVVLLCQFLVLAGNRFWFYILMYLKYNTVVVLC